jgi:hypothetical protein
MAKEEVGKVKILGVRASFLSLFEPNVQTDPDTGKVRETWKGNFLIPKAEAAHMIGIFKGERMPIMAALKAASEEAKTKKWGSKEKWPKLKPEKLFARDGDLEDWDGYAGCHYVSANAQLQDRPSVVTNRKSTDNKWIVAEPGSKGAPYSGCYVNAVLIIWAQDNEHGKRVNAQLKSVQFVRDGEAFGASPVDPNEEFDEDDVSTEASDDDDSPTDDDDSGMV